MLSKAERIKELEGKIVTVCLFCPHRKWATGVYQCTVKRSHCHSKRVIKWLAEIAKLEVESWLAEYKRLEEET